MKISFRKNSGNSYAVIEGSEAEVESLFFTKMISANSVPHLLPLKTEKLNGQTLFLYEITGKRSFEQTFENRKMSCDIFLSFMDALRELSVNLSELLLDADRIILRTDTVFMDHLSNCFWFCADPYSTTDSRNDIRVFFDRLLSLIDYDDHRLVALVFSLSRLTQNDNYSLQDLLSVNLAPVSETDMFLPSLVENNSSENHPASGHEKPADPYDPPDIHSSFIEKAKYYFKGRSFSEIYDAVNSGRIIRLIKETEIPIIHAPAPETETAATERLSPSFDTADLNISDLPFHRLNGMDNASGIVILLDHFPFTIGKGTDSADFHLERPEISRTHCRIYCNEDESFDIEDLNSKNGSFVNGSSLDPYSKEPLLTGDIVTLADLRFIFI